MSGAARALVLYVTLAAAFIQGASAITCYICKSKSGPACDDPFRNSSGVRTSTCQSNACVKAAGFGKDDGVQFSGALRGCGTAATIGCSSLTNEAVPEQHLTEFTGELCYCIGNLCNAASPAVVGGHLIVIFVALSSLAATARTLSP